MKRAKNRDKGPLVTSVEDVMMEISRPVDNSVQVEIAKEFARFLDLLSKRRGDISGLINGVKEDVVSGEFRIRECKWSFSISPIQSKYRLNITFEEGSLHSDELRNFAGQLHRPEDLWAPFIVNAGTRDAKITYLSEFFTAIYAAADGYIRPSTIAQVNIVIGNELA
jgi:hypothetical protein